MGWGRLMYLFVEILGNLGKFRRLNRFNRRYEYAYWEGVFGR